MKPTYQFAVKFYHFEIFVQMINYLRKVLDSKNGLDFDDLEGSTDLYVINRFYTKVTTQIKGQQTSIVKYWDDNQQDGKIFLKDYVYSAIINVMEATGVIGYEGEENKILDDLVMNIFKLAKKVRL